MVGVDLAETDFGVAGVGEFRPAVDAVPALAEAGAVVEDDLDGDGKDEVAFAMEIDSGEVLDLFFVFGFGQPPLDGIGGDAVDGVVEELGSVDGLIEEGAEAGVGGGGGGVVAGEGDWAGMDPGGANRAATSSVEGRS